MSDLINELKYIEKKYGEKFMQFCRSNFATILEEGGKLSKLLDSIISNNSKSLGEDLKEAEIEDDFKEYIYSFFVENQETEYEDVDKNPYELLAQKGYELIECKTEAEIQEFRKYYAENEVICTIYNGGRLKTSLVFLQ